MLDYLKRLNILDASLDARVLMKCIPDFISTL